MNHGQFKEFERIGLERIHELDRVIANPDPSSYLKEFSNLPWIEIQGSIHTPAEISQMKEGFGYLFLIFVSIIEPILSERGTAIFGYMNKFILSFSPLIDARYFTQERDIRFNGRFSTALQGTGGSICLD